MKASARLEAVVKGIDRTRDVGPEEAHARNVMAITGRIHKRQARLRAITREAARLRKELKADRRELRAVLQRDSSVTEERLALAGKADAADRAVALAEQRGAGRLCGHVGPFGVECNRDRQHAGDHGLYRDGHIQAEWRNE